MGRKAVSSSFQARVDVGVWPMSVEFPFELKDRLEAQAAREQRSQAAVIRIATEEYCDRNEPAPKMKTNGAGAPKAKKARAATAKKRARR